jgi:LacI family transcriptional regulator, repressor for deo operon, udp, cdd, tsx, nupC, and nupG
MSLAPYVAIVLQDLAAREGGSKRAIEARYLPLPSARDADSSKNGSSRKGLFASSCKAYAPRMKPTLREVAERAGVSEATVSRVVNERPGVAARTRRQVLRALDELGYAPAGLAVAAAWTGTVGVITPELVNPVFPAFAQAIEARLSRAGLTTILCTATDDGTAEGDHVALLVQRGVAGLIIVSGLHADTTADHRRYRQLHEQGVPLVLVNGVVEGLAVPFVSADEATAAELGVRHLAHLGHTRVGLANGPRRFQPSQHLLAGYLRGLRAAFGHADEDLVVEGVSSVEGGHLAMARLLELGATGVLAASDLMALGAIRAAHERGLEVPGDVSVVGYDDIALAAFTDPPLTTLRQPVRAMGEAAAGALVQLVQADGAPAPTGEYLFRPELVVRGSTGPCRHRVLPA